MSILGAKHALTSEELKFCRVYLAMGETNAAEAWRRAFPNLAFPKSDDGSDAEPLASKEVSRRANQLLKADHIQRYIAELKRPTSEHARGVLADQILTGDDQQALRAAQRALDEEDKLGFRDAVDRFWEVTAEAGAEIVVPLPGEASGDVTCPDCYRRFRATLPVEVVVPVAEMFPLEGKDRDVS